MIDKKVEAETESRINKILEETVCSQYIILNTDAPAFKKWKLENNLLLAEFISHQYPEFTILITSLPENQSLIESALLEKKIARVRYFPTPDIHAMTALIRNSQLVITPDTSIVHLTSAENKPVIAFYLAASEWLPYKISSYVILPKKGDPISSIPFEVVKEGVITMFSNMDSAEKNIIRIVHCDNPLEIEIRK